MTDSNDVFEGSEVPSPAAVVPLDDVERQAFAERLVAQAQSAGVQLIGPGGLLADIAKRVIETGLEVGVQALNRRPLISDRKKPTSRQLWPGGHCSVGTAISGGWVVDAVARQPCCGWWVAWAA